MKNVCFWSLCASLLFASCNSGELPYKTSSLPVEKRVEDLMSRMTLEEKAAQLDMLSANDVMSDAEHFREEQAVHFIDSMCIGSIHDFYPQTAALSNEIQRRAVENSRLGIPVLFIEEGLHGYCGVGSTNFPVPIGNASSWDTTLMHHIGRVIGTEARAHGIHFLLCPNLDLARDPRWGRTEETYGEDVYLSSRMAVNMVKGMQGADLKDNNAVAAEPKHFGIHGIPENGSNTGPVFIGEREARSTHLYIFEKAVTEAKAKGIMAAYHDIDGIPCISSPWLLTDLLRKEWGFDGMVVTDLGAIRRLVAPHYTAAGPKEAITQAVNAGLDMQFYDFPHDVFQKAVAEAVKDGSIPKDKLDRAVSAVLRMKFELGLFENPYTDESLIANVFHSGKHRELALEAGRKSVILLKNDGSLLPFSKNIKRLALIGNLANTPSIGGYGPRQATGVTLYEALKKKYGESMQIDLIQTGISNQYETVSSEWLSNTVRPAQKGVYTEYFNNTDLSGQPAYTAVEEKIQGYWHNLSPAPGIDPGHFSTRYSGVISVPTGGIYELSISSNGFGKLYVNSQLLIDNWGETNRARGKSERIELRAGQKIAVKVEYAKTNENASVEMRWRIVEYKNTKEYFDRVTRAVAAADAAIVAVGETDREVGEGKDRQNLNLKPMDVEMLQAAAKGGKPFASVLLNGRPLVFTPVAETSAAIVEAWFPGESGGEAVADVLFGDYNPSGKLTVSIPKYQGQLPVYYSKKTSSPRNYTDGNGDPLYSFGHGLSYSTFELSGMTVTPAEPTIKDRIAVTVDVKNTSAADGVETVQLYVRDKIASVVTPVKALKGFSQVFLKAGETKTVTMLLKPEEHLWLINRDMKRVVEPGEFELMAGTSSADIRLTQTIHLK
ncbi:MAG: glycoside hydrolase family 3 C-terminal domain-containing protein [Bacteroidales bacterium]|jgi:beta-glucosidase|nr:glycoside hydrolase family 3 C-terminal domain-containing protein [Bacteroidales bacterium]